MPFPRPLASQKTLDFSFSGLKTAVLLYVEKHGREAIVENDQHLRDLAASFQAAAIDSLLGKTRRALERERIESLAVVGGVACNRGLRAALAEMKKRGTGGLKRLWIPPPVLCTDNAAMIAGLAGQVPRENKRPLDLALNADPGWELEESLEPSM